MSKGLFLVLILVILQSSPLWASKNAETEPPLFRSHFDFMERGSTGVRYVIIIENIDYRRIECDVYALPIAVDMMPNTTNNRGLVFDSANVHDLHDEGRRQLMSEIGRETFIFWGYLNVTFLDYDVEGQQEAFVKFCYHLNNDKDRSDLCYWHICDAVLVNTIGDVNPSKWHDNLLQFGNVEDVVSSSTGDGSQCSSF